jgi:hypothetical protein
VQCIVNWCRQTNFAIRISAWRTRHAVHFRRIPCCHKAASVFFRGTQWSGAAKIMLTRDQHPIGLPSSHSGLDNNY